MSDKIEFTRNYADHSTDQGFQFEFYCDRCGTGYRTHFAAYTLGQVSGAVDAASSLFGGIFGKASDLAGRAKSATWQKAHDDAFIKAMQELKPDFFQCPRCSRWVCKKSCWNNEKGLCKECAPSIEVELAAAQAAKTTEAIWQNATVSDEGKALTDASNFKQELRANNCSNCGAPLTGNVKFCPECGSPVKPKEAHCTECGAKLAPGAKFCAECGHKVNG